MSQRDHVRLNIQKIQGDKWTRRKDRVVVEEPMEIRLQGGDTELTAPFSLAVTMRTPGHDFELTMGFLYAEGIIQKNSDVVQMTHCLSTANSERSTGTNFYNVVSVQLAKSVSFSPIHLHRHITTSASCGLCGKASIEALQLAECPPLVPNSPTFTPAQLHQLGDSIASQQTLFAQTGGIHAAALFDASGQLLSLREDIGRHNAVDKLVGQQLLAEQMPLTSCLLWVSGRASFELVQKAARAGIPIMVAVGAPSNLAIELAETCQMTLVGFAREQRLNLYSDAGRIIAA